MTIEGERIHGDAVQFARLATLDEQHSAASHAHTELGETADEAVEDVAGEPAGLEVAHFVGHGELL